jgi:hypothetical protein
MKRIQVAVPFVFAVLMFMGLFLSSQPALAQDVGGLRAIQQQPDQPYSQPSAPELTKFTGTIVLDGDVLVLSDNTTGITYQLDNQRTAYQFVNKNVVVTGVLEVSTGTIRLSRIEPA